MLLLLSTSLLAQDAITGLQTEHLDVPLGIDAAQPRLSWRILSDRADFCQKAYRILVGTDSAQVAALQANVWDSHTVSNADPITTYTGPALNPRTRYYWTVQVRDEKDNTLTAPVAWFETGMMRMSEWRGAWIGDGANREHKLAPYFRKEFSTRKAIKSARAYIAAAGLYELTLNGQRVGDHMLDPLYTRYDRRNLYVTHDVTSLIQQGRNCLGVMLGNGFYNHQAKAVWDFDQAPWRNRPTFCLDLWLTYDDGTTQVVKSDLTWRTSGGDIVCNNIYTGEQRDFRHTQTGWDRPGFDQKHWRGVGYRSVPSQNVSAQQARPIRIDWERKAVSLNQLNDTTWVFDYGQNMAGVTHLSLQGEEGTVLRISCGERLNADGSLDLSNIDIYYRGDSRTDPFQTDIVTLSGRHDDYITQTGYKGFRYAQVVSSRPMALTTDHLTACFIHSDVPQVGTITASVPIIEKLMHASRMSYLSNLMGLPTDCPQREKNGWTGDGHLAIEAALYNYDAITVYEKWLADHRDEQQPNGVLPDIIPTGGWGYGTDNGLDWTSTIAIIPWNLYLFYGDSRPLRDNYDNIKRYVDYVDKNYPSHLTTWGRGDWVPVTVGSNKEFTSSIYFYTDARILGQAAQLLGRHDDADYYLGLAGDILQAINDKYLDREKGIYASGTMTELCVPLYWGIVPNDMRERVAENLNRKVLDAGCHLDVGVLGCKALLNALCENGYQETAYRVAIQNTYPSWGFWVEQGMTTLTENWSLEGTQDRSYNHMMFGEIGAWFYKGLAGLYPDAQAPGFRHIRLRPYFPDGLDHFCATHQTPYGEAASGWNGKGRKLTYTATVPPSCTATLTLPAGWLTTDGKSELTLTAGRHVLKLNRQGKGK